MIQTIKNNIKLLLVAVLVAVPVLAVATPQIAGAQTIEEGLCSGVNLGVGSGNSCENDTEAEGRIQGLISLIINIFSIVVGVVSVIMIIIGGLKYITSSGDSNNVTSAKNTILYAIIGLVIVALAQLIVRFVLSRALGAEGEV